MKYLLYFLAIPLFCVMGCESASLNSSQCAGSHVYKKDDFVKGCVIKCKNFELEHFDVRLSNEQTVFWIGINCLDPDTGCIEKNILKGEYAFTVLYRHDDCRDGRWVFCKKVNLTKDNQVVELEIPWNHRQITVDFTNAEISKVFKKYGKGVKPEYYRVAGLLESYKNGEKTSYKEWVHFRMTDLLTKNVVTSVDECAHMNPGKYRLRLFFISSGLGNIKDNDMLDGREIGYIDFEIKDDKCSVLKLKL